MPLEVPLEPVCFVDCLCRHRHVKLRLVILFLLFTLAKAFAIYVVDRFESSNFLQPNMHDIRSERNMQVLHYMTLYTILA